jgi:hypothetical protein
VDVFGIFVNLIPGFWNFAVSQAFRYVILSAHALWDKVQIFVNIGSGGDGFKDMWHFII